MFVMPGPIKDALETERFAIFLGNDINNSPTVRVATTTRGSVERLTP
jgi:hypothetical protein